MKILSKRILYDAAGHPVEVRMDYDEFVRLEKAVESVEPTSAYDRMMSFAGKVQWNEDPLEYQRRLREEWD